MSNAYSPLTTHVLDTSKGVPAKVVPIKVQRLEVDSTWKTLKQGVTNDDGRLPGLLTKEEFTPGSYKLIFDTYTYFKSQGLEAFYPHVEVTFNIIDANQHYHIPLLLSPFGYSTYRGS